MDASVVETELVHVSGYGPVPRPVGDDRVVLERAHRVAPGVVRLQPIGPVQVGGRQVVEVHREHVRRASEPAVAVLGRLRHAAGAASGDRAQLDVLVQVGVARGGVIGARKHPYVPGRFGEGRRSHPVLLVPERLRGRPPEAGRDRIGRSGEHPDQEHRADRQDRPPAHRFSSPRPSHCCTPCQKGHPTGRRSCPEGSALRQSPGDISGASTGLSGYTCSRAGVGPVEILFPLVRSLLVVVRERISPIRERVRSSLITRPLRRNLPQPIATRCNRNATTRIAGAQPYTVCPRLVHAQ